MGRLRESVANVSGAVDVLRRRKGRQQMIAQSRAPTRPTTLGCRDIRFDDPVFDGESAGDKGESFVVRYERCSSCYRVSGDHHVERPEGDTGSSAGGSQVTVDCYGLPIPRQHLNAKQKFTHETRHRNQSHFRNRKITVYQDIVDFPVTIRLYLL